MILFRILVRDIRRSLGTIVLVFAFVTLSALLVSGGIGLIVTLNGALDNLFTAARVPDVVQMHAGELDRNAIHEWATANDLVEVYQIDEMISVEGETLSLGDETVSEEGSVMDISFVGQNESFDFLLDCNNLPYHPEPGAIGVPVYYAERDDLSPGDPVTIRNGEIERTFTIGAFIRDAQMNPAIIHSKRFVFHATDLAELREVFPDREYLIAFRLSDPERSDEFIAAYREAGLPQIGPTVDRTIFRALNALSDGIVSAVVILLSGVLMVIALLCLRFSILASIEEDYREIGVMKAIGMPSRKIRRIYVAKYLAVALLASVAGYFGSLPLLDLLTTGINRFLGDTQIGIAGRVLPIIAAFLVFLVVVVSCLIVLRRFRRISAVGALRSLALDDRGRNDRAPHLRRWGAVGVNTALGLRDVLQRPRHYTLLGFIFFFAAFIIIVPVHFLTTITSPSFVSYMGIGESDIRIDLRQSEGMTHRYHEVIRVLDTDPYVVRYAALVSSQFTLHHENGKEESIVIETGDLELFPPDYLDGRGPHDSGEIALSYLNAREMERGIGDTVSLVVDGREVPLDVTGIYQDVTNGGRTAKGLLPHDDDRVLWYSFAVDLAENADLHETAQRYTARFAPARVTDLEGYMAQTLGSTIDALRTVTIVAFAVGLGVSVLVTSLFLNLLIRKDGPRNTVMRWIGFSRKDIRRQYQTTVLTVLVAGLSLGTVFSNTLGERLVSFLWSFMGAARIDFVVAPFLAYFALPMAFAVTVVITTRINMSGINTTSGGNR